MEVEEDNSKPTDTETELDSTMTISLASMTAFSTTPDMMHI